MWQFKFVLRREVQGHPGSLNFPVLCQHRASTLGRPTGQSCLGLTGLHGRSGPFMGRAESKAKLVMSEDLPLISYFKDQPHRLPESCLFLDIFTPHLCNSEKQLPVQEGCVLEYWCIYITVQKNAQLSLWLFILKAFWAVDSRFLNLLVEINHRVCQL